MASNLRIASSRVEERPTRRVEPDHLFEALDGRQFRLGGREWRVDVYGVIDDGPRRWVQVSLAGTQRRMMTLRLASSHGAQHAVLSLSSWLANPAASQSVLNVA